MKILECHSYKPEGGDIRFSAFGAKLPDGRTIEEAYQGAKRDKNGKPFENPKGKNPEYLFLNGKLEPCTPDLRHQFYRMLWNIHFLHNPSLFNEACEYTLFRDKYADQGIVFSTEQYVDKLFSVAGGCNQARAIAQIIVLGWGSNSVTTIECLVKAKRRYLKNFPPKNVSFEKDRFTQMQGTMEQSHLARENGEDQRARELAQEAMIMMNKEALKGLAHPPLEKTHLVFGELADLSQPAGYNEGKKVIEIDIQVVEGSPLHQQLLELLTAHNR